MYWGGFWEVNTVITHQGSPNPHELEETYLKLIFQDDENESEGEIEEGRV